MVVRPQVVPSPCTRTPSNSSVDPTAQISLAVLDQICCRLSVDPVATADQAVPFQCKNPGLLIAQASLFVRAHRAPTTWPVEFSPRAQVVPFQCARPPPLTQISSAVVPAMELELSGTGGLDHA